jgi:hypothetical protein
LFLNIINEHVSRHMNVRTSNSKHEVTRLKHDGFHIPSCPPRVWICQRGATIIYNNLAELQHHLETCASSSCQVRPLVIPIYTSHRDTSHLQTTQLVLPSQHKAPRRSNLAVLQNHTPPSYNHIHTTYTMTHTYKFNVAMSCGGCSGAIERVLKKLEGQSCSAGALRPNIC